jgi:Leishmanolysin
MLNNHFDNRNEFAGDQAVGRGHPHVLDLNVHVPDTARGVVGVDLTHIIHTNDVEAAKGGGHGGGTGGGGGGTTFSPYTSGSADGSGFNITITFNGTWTQELHDVFVNAANQLTSIIAGDLPNVSVRNRGTTTTVDDITISAELGQIDGLYGVLGQAGPTSLRTGSYLPATAQMQFDIVDVNDMGVTVFSDVVLHEMSHSLGFGSIWDRLSLVSNGEFTGANAVQAHHNLGGTGFIAVEQDGGSGTAGSHWDEETFNNELMTGYINDGENYFTAMSAASFADLGYQLSSNYLNYVETGYHLV